MTKRIDLLFEKYSVPVILILGVALLVVWVIGWPMVALGIFLFGTAFIISSTLLELRRIVTAIDFNRERILASVMIRDRKQSKRLIFDYISKSLGQATSWPFGAAIGMLASLVTGKWRANGSQSIYEQQRERFFYFPLSLAVLLSFLLQTIFMLEGFAYEIRSTNFFQIAVGIQILGFVGFSLHFFARHEFMKNFSDSAMSPFIFCVIASILSFSCAISIRLLYSVTYLGMQDNLNLNTIFGILKMIIVNSGFFDIIELIKNSNNFDSFLSQLSDLLASVNLTKALDIFLFFAVLLAFSRSVLTSIRFQRDDDDHQVRAVNYLNAGNFEKARDEVADMENTQRQAQFFYVFALADCNYDEFVRFVEMVEPGNEIYAFGNDPCVVQYAALADTLVRVPFSFDEFCVLAQEYWDRHQNIATVRRQRYSDS